MNKIITTALVLVSTAASAEYAMVVHGLSKHTGTVAYNEHNLGVAIRKQTSEDLSIQIGTYKNSYNKQSVYGIANWQLVRVGNLSFGAFGGVASGYPHPIVAGGLVRYDLGGIDVTIRAVPKFGKYDGVVAIELGMKY